MWCSGIAQIYGGLERAVHLRLHLICKYDNVMMTLCSTPLCHKMPLQERGQAIWKDDLIPPGDRSSENWGPNSAWGQVIWKDVGFISSEGTPRLKTWPNSTEHFKWVLTDDIDHAILDLLSLTVLCRGVSSSEGTPHLKIWTHFEIYSCFTEVFSVKDQQDYLNYQR